MYRSDDILVSIICLTYCQEDYIRQCLDGFVMQKTDFRYEVLVNDDASSDSTPDILREYEQKYPDIVKPVYQTVNQYSQGVRIADDILIPLAQGKYLAFCEGDDYWCDENKLQKQIDFLESHPDYTVCVHNTRNVYLRGRHREETYPHEDKDLTLADVVMVGSQSFQSSANVIRKDFYMNLPEYALLGGIVEDYPDAVYYTTEGKVRYLGDVMSVHLIGTKNSWTRTILPFHETRAEFFSDIIKMLKAANEHTGYKFNELFTEAIEFNEYNLLQSKQDYKSLVKVKKFYRREPLVVRIVYRLFAWFPFLIKISNFIRER